MYKNIDHETRVASLKTITLFDGLNHELLIGLSKLTVIRTLKKNDLVFEQGDVPNKFSFVNKGMVKIIRSLKPGQEMILRVVTEGECFGVIAIFIDQKYLARAVCEGEVTLVEIPKEPFLKFLDEHPVMYRKFLKLICQKTYNMERKVPEMALTRIETRVSKILLNLTEKIGFVDNGQHKIEIPLTRKEIAAMAGTTTETVVRVLGKMEKNNVITIQKHLITLNNLEYLESLVDEYDHLKKL